MKRPKLEIWKIGLLQPYDKNARIHKPEQVTKIAKSIEQFGWTIPILISKEGEIIAGHGRLMAAEQLELKKVPVMIEDYMTEAQRRAYRLADNKLTEMGKWDETLLATEIQDLINSPIDMDALGFSQEEVDNLLEPETKPHYKEVDAPKETLTNPGELWHLGDHRLICGDATDPEIVKQLMGDERATLFATDPPYLVDYDGSNRFDQSVVWKNELKMDEKADEQGIELYQGFIKAAIEHAIKPDAAIYLWHADLRRPLMEHIWKENGINLHQVLIWDKGNPVIGRTDYYWQHEPCMYGWRGDGRPRFAKQKKDNTSMWSMKRLSPSEKPDHPTAKPPELFGIPMRKHVEVGGICYEPFSGSGSQIIAGEENGRRVFAIEINPIYVDVAIKRWEEATGQKATREGDGA